LSVVIPAYEAARYLHETLDSVAAQTEPVDSIVVVDDGSTDATADVATSWAASALVPVTVLRQANGGAGAARRVGLAHTDSELVSFLDADDRWLPDTAARLVAVLDDHPKALVVFGSLRSFTDESLSADVAARRMGFGGGPGYCLSASVVRRRAFDELGPFGDHTFSSVDWFARLIEAGPTAAVALDEVVGERRVHSRNSSFNERDRTALYAQALKASLDRRRTARTVDP